MVLFLYSSLYGGYTLLESVHFDLPNRRDLIVGTLLKFHYGADFEW